MSRKPFGVVTAAGQWVPQDVLTHYATKDESKQLSDRFEQIYARNGLVEPLYNPESLARVLEINTYHYRACKTKARDTAGLGWLLEPLVEEPSNEQREQIRAYLDGLDQPLAMTLDRCQLDYESVGWAAMEIVRKGHEPGAELVAVKHLPAHTLRMHRDGNRFAQVRGVKTRWFKRAEYERDVDQDAGSQHALGSLPDTKRATELLVWINYTPRSDYYGLPDVIPALGAIHGDIARRDYNIAFFDNYGVPAYAVFITGDFDEGEIDEHGHTDLEKAIERHFKKLAKNPHSTLVLSIPTREDGQQVKVEFQPLAVDVEEASFRLYRQDNRDEVLAAHGVPPYRAGISETGALGQNVAQETTEIYKTSVIEPRQTIIENLFNRYVLRGAFGVTDWRWKLAEIDTRDEKHDLEMLTGLFDRGAISADELRAQFAERYGLEGDAPEPAESAVDIEAVERALKHFQLDVQRLAATEVSYANGNGRGAGLPG